MPRFQVFKEGVFQQADLLFLPDDKGYKFALVVVDDASRHVDAEPLKQRTTKAVKDGFKKIWARKILKKPTGGVLEVDAGVEFKQDVPAFLKSMNISMRVAKPQRHRQQALVEKANYTIAKALFHRMTAQELLTGDQSTEWKDDLKTVVKLLNLKTGPFEEPKEHDEEIKAEGDSTKLLDIGTQVRVKLDAPRQMLGEHSKALSGRFRATDVRWHPKIRTIVDVILKPAFPPMYLLDGDQTDKHVELVGYTRPQLQVVNEVQNDPPGKIVIRGDPKTYVVKKILDRRIKNNKYEYLIQWRGYDEQTWEPRDALTETIIKTIEAYDAKYDAEYPDKVIQLNNNKRAKRSK